MNSVPVLRMLAITVLSFALTLIVNTLDPAVYGHKVLQLAPARPNTVLGLTTFFGTLMGTILLPVMGALSDRSQTPWGRRVPFILIGGGMLFGTLYLIAAAPSLAVFVLAVLLFRLSENVLAGPWQALFPDMIPMRQRGQASGLRSLFDILGIILGRFAAGQIVGRSEQWGDIAVYLAVSLPAFVLLISVAITVWGARDTFDTAPQQVLAVSEALRGAFHLDLKTYPAFGWWFANRFLFWTAFTTMGTFLLFFTIDVLGLPEAAAQRYLGTLTAIIGVSILLIALPAGRLADRLGRKPLVILGGLLAFVGTGLVVVLRDLVLLGFAGGLIGLGAGIFVSANFALITDIVPQLEAARYLGLASIASAGGSAMARLLGGTIVDPLNTYLSSSSAGYLALYGLAALFFLLSSLTAVALPAPKLESESPTGSS